MSSFVTSESRWISLTERSRSSFALVYLLCAGEDLSLSGDADEGCQWEIQSDKGWTPYWDPRLRALMGVILL
jgi:hypothetical protein